jgi:Replication-relaxation
MTAEPSRRPAVRSLTATERSLMLSLARLGAAPAEPLSRLAGARSNIRSAQRHLASLTTRELIARSRTPGLPAVFSVTRTGYRSLGLPPGWRPSPSQLQHTLAVAAVLADLMVTGPLAEASWQGEAQLRAAAGSRRAAVPDALLHAGQLPIALEVDRGTESAAAWSRKLGRYQAAGLLTASPLLVVTISTRHAARILGLAQAAGIHAAVAVRADLDAWAGGLPTATPITHVATARGGELLGSWLTDMVKRHERT